MIGIFLDTETNGLNITKHTILEIALKLIDLRSGELKATYDTLIQVTPEQWQQSDPESLAINGFTWDKTLAGIPKEQVKKELCQLFESWKIQRGEAVFICQNPSFDRAFFTHLVSPEEQEAKQWPYHWLDLASMYWVKGIESGKVDPTRFPWKTGVSKDSIAKTYKLPPEEKPHRAINGVNHLILCYKTVVGFPNNS